MAALPQWRLEKLPARRDSKKNFAITSGNGSRDIMIICGKGEFLDLEHLATPESPRTERIWESNIRFSKPVTRNGDPENHKNATGRRMIPVRRAIAIYGSPLGFWITRIVCALQSILWLCLLVVVAGLKSYTWYLLLVGALGMFQNAVVAAMNRKPEKRNLPMRRVDCMVQRKVMDGLMDLEKKYPNFGRHLLREFFPGHLRKNEQLWWNGEHEAYDKERSDAPSRRDLDDLGLDYYNQAATSDSYYHPDHRNPYDEKIVPGSQGSIGYYSPELPLPSAAHVVTISDSNASPPWNMKDQPMSNSPVPIQSPDKILTNKPRETTLLNKPGSQRAINTRHTKPIMPDQVADPYQGSKLIDNSKTDRYSSASLSDPLSLPW